MAVGDVVSKDGDAAQEIGPTYPPAKIAVGWSIDSVSGEPVPNKSTNGAAHVNLSGGMDARGNYPATWFVPFSDTAADVNDNTVVYETPTDVSMFNHHEYSIVTAPGSGAVEVFISHDGTNYETTPIQVISDALVIGAAIQSVNEMTAVGNYYFDRKVVSWKLQNKGATTGAATAIRGSHSVI